MIHLWLSLVIILKSGLLISGQSDSGSDASSSGAGGTSSSGAGGASSGYGTSSNGITQFPLIFGKISASTTPLDFTELGEVTSLCFSGFNMKTCRAIQPTDETELFYELPYYRLNLAKPAQYCLQCCSTTPRFVDLWDISCTVDIFTAVTTNVFGSEFRFARLQSLTDTTVVRCPLKRSSCQYDSSDNLIACTPTTNTTTTYLTGYSLKLNVVEYNSGPSYWRGVSSCSAVAYERNHTLVAGEKFEEIITMSFAPQPFAVQDYYNLLWLLLFFILVIYALLYFFRTASCVICQKKLVFGRKRCYMCLFYCADLPDPVLLDALEAKGRRIIDADFRPKLDNYKRAYKFLFRDLPKTCRRAWKGTQQMLGDMSGFVSRFSRNQRTVVVIPVDTDMALENNVDIESKRSTRDDGDVDGDDDGKDNRPVTVERRGYDDDMIPSDGYHDDVTPRSRSGGLFLETGASPSPERKRGKSRETRRKSRKDRDSGSGAGVEDGDAADDEHSSERNWQKQTNAYYSTGADGAEEKTADGEMNNDQTGAASGLQQQEKGGVTVTLFHSLLNSFTRSNQNVHNDVDNNDRVSVISGRSKNSYSSLPSLPPRLKALVDSMAKTMRPKKHHNPHELHYPRQVIVDAVNEDGRHIIKNAEDYRTSKKQSEGKNRKKQRGSQSRSGPE